MTILLHKEMMKRLQKECKDAKGQKHWAKMHGVSPQYLNDVLRGKSEAGPLILKAMKLTVGEKLYVKPGTKITNQTILEKAIELKARNKKLAVEAANRKKALSELDYD